MADQVHNEPKYHVLLIGVDNYHKAELHGCVNDIDAVQRMLLGPRTAALRDRIRIKRLASPLPGTTHETAIPEQPATLKNIRAALDELATNVVAAGDRVFIFYSGHGSQVEVKASGERKFHREALVPVDYDADLPAPRRMLFDYELNAKLLAITEQTKSVAVVLDCCHAAGATRDATEDSKQRPRFLDLRAIVGAVLEPLPDPGSEEPPVATGGAGRAVDPRGHRLGGGVDACHVVCACLNHEVAKEDVGSEVRQGLFTKALITALEAATEVELSSVTWAWIWQSMQVYIEERNPWQHLWMSGDRGRAVLAGPPVKGDGGIPVRQTSEGYRIEAGTLMSITPGAVFAVYGPKPDEFPPLDADTARLGTLHVIHAERAWATATATTAFVLPPGARARLITPGPGARLRCGVIPSNPAIEAKIQNSDLLELVQPGDKAAVRLELCEGSWRLTDDKHGITTGSPVLFQLKPDEIDAAPALLEHYRRYSLPLRVAERATDLPGGLEMRVLACPTPDLTPKEAQSAPLLDAPSSNGTCDVQSGAKVCFSVHNQSGHRLKVALINVGASGKVRVLGDLIIEDGAFYRFWARGNLGLPFKMVPPQGTLCCCIDRFVAIGRTALNDDLHPLEVKTAFADTVRAALGGRDAADGTDDGTDGTAALERWTATEVIVRTSVPQA